jgi:drug/metabolite transporter (DMT)-like permease
MVLTTVDSLITTTVTAAIGAVLLLLVSMSLEGPAAWGSLTAAPTAAWFSIVALALGATALAYAWCLNGVKVLGAGTAAACMSLVPLFGLVFSGLWRGETLTASPLVGGAMAILGMRLMNWGRLRMANFPAVANDSYLK